MLLVSSPLFALPFGDDGVLLLCVMSLLDVRVNASGVRMAKVLLGGARAEAVVPASEAGDALEGARLVAAVGDAEAERPFLL